MHCRQEHVCYPTISYIIDPVAAGFSPDDLYWLSPQMVPFSQAQSGDVYLAVGARKVVRYVEATGTRPSGGAIGVIIESESVPTGAF